MESNCDEFHLHESLLRIPAKEKQPKKLSVQGISPLQQKKQFTLFYNEFVISLVNC